MKLNHLAEGVGTLCDNCTAACCRSHALIKVTRDDNTPMECRNRGFDYDSMKLMDDPDFGGQRCICLGPNHKCTIYEDRPSTCRAFEMGGSQCMYVRKEYLN
jgi:Fe-S-cluster containining protein